MYRIVGNFRAWGKIFVYLENSDFREYKSLIACTAFIRYGKPRLR